VEWNESPKSIHDYERASPIKAASVMPLPAQRSDVSAALTSIWGTKSMIFLRYQLKALTRHSDPGYNALKLRFYRIFTSSGTSNPRRYATSINGQGRSTQRRIIERQPALWVEVRIPPWSMRSAYPEMGGQKRTHKMKWCQKSAQNSRHHLHA